MNKHFVNRPLRILAVIVLINFVCAVFSNAQTLTDLVPVTYQSSRSDTPTSSVEIFAGTPLPKALKILEKRFHVAFLYQSRLLRNKTVKKNQEIPDDVILAAKNVIDDYPLKVKELNPLSYGIVSSNDRKPVHTQKVRKKPASIHGKVTDASTGESLIGADILLQGTSIGVATNNNGNYAIDNISAGEYTIRVSYIGYETRKIKVQLKSGESLTKDVKLEPVGIGGKTVTVTAQASGQNAAINQQLTSDKIVNVVSAARIQALPDANAAESVGRLPGVSLVRDGGEASKVVIRGLAPKYNEITIDGVQMASTNSNDRSTNLSMISSSMLSGIEVSKTVTPDMDAAVLGGVVNFNIREAKETKNGKPEVHLLAQGGYKNLLNKYNNYKFVGSIGDRFFNKRLGIYAQGVVERVNLTSDRLGGSYGHILVNSGQQAQPVLNNLNLSFNPRNRHRYDATLVMDYKLPKGKIDLMNFFSSSNTDIQSRSQSYGLTGNDITFGAGVSPNTLNVMTNLLDYKQELFTLNMDAKVSNSYSENSNPNNWSVNFLQNSAGTGSLSNSLSPKDAAQQGSDLINLDNAFFNGINTSNSINKQRNITGSVDFKRTFNLSDLITVKLKFGGEYRYTHRFYDYNSGSGGIYYPGNKDARAAIVKAFPWMTQAPYNIKADGTQQLPITLFENKKYSYGTFLNNDYTMGTATNFGLLSQSVDIVKNIGLNKKAAVSGDYSPDVYGSIASDYSGNEYRKAAYIMTTINIGPSVTILPGVRYQGLKTSYSAARFDNASTPNPYPNTIPHQDTTINQYHGYWLPDILLRYKPVKWLDLRLAYTNTISYPDFSAIIPRIDIFTSSVTWNNYALKPARSKNYDASISLYSNAIGLFTAGGFLKRIDDMIFSQGGIYITDPSKYEGLPSYTRNFYMSTSINDPYRVDDWGVELDWQTHFWYLPKPLNGLVMNVNFTHIFTKAKYPYVRTVPGTYPRYIPTHIDTFYTARLINQPNDVINLAMGYDYKGFSGRVSMQYQSNIFDRANFWPSMRSDKRTYLRWDLSVKQALPWKGLHVFLDLNNINGESDIYSIRGSGFPTSIQDYGMTGDIGLRWSIE